MPPVRHQTSAIPNRKVLPFIVTRDQSKIKRQLGVDAVEKGILRESPHNIDSTLEAGTQS
jgi:hypothetical protein